jgi:tetratricopeptide (TPR) repeat protein
VDLRRALRSGVAAVSIASVVAPAGAAPAPRTAQAAYGGLDVRVAQAATFSRVEFRGAGRVASHRDGQTLTFDFGHDGDPDIARLRTSPPRWIKATEKRHEHGKLQIVLTLADDADAKVGAADGATFVNVFERPPPDPAKVEPQPAAAVVEPEPTRPNPVPAGGVVHMVSKIVNGQVQLSFPWANPAGAAVFRRGDTVWVVFDAAADLDVSHTPRGLSQFSTVRASRGPDYTALKINASHGVPVFASIAGNVWTITLGPGDPPAFTPITVTRDDADGPAALKAPVAGATRVIHMPDPDAGDVLTVVTALGPAKGLLSRRSYVQAALLPSAQGLVVESHVADLTVSHEGDIVHIGRPGGLTLSSKWSTQAAASDADELGPLAPATMPALIDSQWAKTGAGGFLSRYRTLVAAAAAEGGNPSKTATTAARMALARFLVGSELSYEAIGVLNDTARASPQIMDTQEFRGLRGVARVMARRYREAEADFSSPVLADDPSSALWRSYIAAQIAQWPETRAQFSKGAEAFALFSPNWKARFARADAQAALAQGDLSDADAHVRLALADKTDPAEALATRLVQAEVAQAQGQKDRALRIYAAVATAPMEQLAAPALLKATQIRLETGKLTPAQAASVFDGLRYRWRGDATELETIRALGQLYLSQGRYREALEVLRSAGSRLPDLPEAVKLQADLAVAFRSLFLNGAADGLEPIQALALFYDFKELTPIGADGDLMVRKLVRRLVDVDLLDQAADLLKYQADNRLDGVPRAQVATDLAVIYLMDRKPEQALIAINSSRTTVLPAALNNERRLIEARAWMGVGRYDAALEIVEKDKSKEAEDLRSEIAWKQKDWAKAGPIFEKALGQRWRDPTPLSAEDEGRLLRAGVAYSLAGDDAALTRMNQQYQGFYDKARNPDALRIALAGVSNGHVNVADFGRISADNEAFAGWVGKMKVRFQTAPAPLGTGKPAPAAAAAKQAAIPAAKPAAPARPGPAPKPSTPAPKPAAAKG